MQLAANPRYKWYVVGMLWGISFFNYADRSAISALYPLLGKEMNLDSVQIGLLGSAFAWTYGLTAPLAGWIIDRIKRTTAILSGLFAWSVICMATAVSRRFEHLLFFMGAEALGETFYYPASMALVSDYHGKETRSRAMGIHQTSVYMGTVGGGFFAGLIGQYYGWRWSFVVFGALGILLGILLAKFLVEPRRGAADGLTVTEKMPLGQFLKMIWGKPTVLLLMAAFISANFVAVVLLAWMPKYFNDKFGLPLATTALIATLGAQLPTMIGALGGGWLADKLRLRTIKGRMLVQAGGLLLAAPFVFLCGRGESFALVLTGLVIWGLGKGLHDANIWASLFEVIRPEARGTAAGFMNMVGWLGGGSGPVIIGWLAQTYGLGGAISMASGVYVLGALLFCAAMTFTLRRDLAAA